MKRAVVGSSSLIALALAVGMAVATQARAQATTSTDVFRFDFTGFVFFHPCANGGVGEDVIFFGELLVAVHSTTTPRGQAVFHVTRAAPHLTAIGLDTGALYLPVGVTKSTQVLTQGATQFTFIDRSLLIGVGQTEDVILKTTIHFTINANGKLSAEIEDVEVICR
jgi:hypothetical protein